LLLPCPSAWAQQPTAAERQAQEKFQQGLDQMRARNFEQACALLEQSLALNKDITTQFRLGECYEMIGRTASAWRQFDEVAQLAELAELRAKRRLAAEKATAIATKLMKVRLDLAVEAQRIVGLTVTLDGEPYPESRWGFPFRLDPGSHRFAASAPGYRDWQQEFRITQEGKTKVITLPALQPAEPGSEQAEPEEESEEPDAPAPEGEGSLLGPVGLGIAGAGVVALVIGVGVGVAGKSRFDDAVASSSCDEARGVCNQDGLDEQDSALLMGDVATALVIVGGVATMTGLVLGIVALTGSGDEPADTATLSLSVKPGALSLEGTF